MDYLRIFWWLFKFCCLMLVIIQTFMSIRNSFYSGKTTTTRETKKIKDKDFQFPVKLYILVKPGLRLDKLIEFGYNGSYNYFRGISFNESVVGWASAKAGNVTGKINLGKFHFKLASFSWFFLFIRLFLCPHF